MYRSAIGSRGSQQIPRNVTLSSLSIVTHSERTDETWTIEATVLRLVILRVVLCLDVAVFVHLEPAKQSINLVFQVGGESLISACESDSKRTAIRYRCAAY